MSSFRDQYKCGLMTMPWVVFRDQYKGGLMTMPWVVSEINKKWFNDQVISSFRDQYKFSIQ